MAQILKVNISHFVTNSRIMGPRRSEKYSMIKPDTERQTAEPENSTPLGYMNTFVGILLLIVVLVIAIPSIASASSNANPLAYRSIQNDVAEVGLFPHTFEAGLKAFNHGNHAQALRIWRPIAESGHVLAQYNIGIAYSRGAGVKKDMVLASRWWKRSAVQGHRDSAYNLGLVYARGDKGLPQDMVLAAHWWQQAAIHGDAIAQFNLGMMYARGEGVKQNMDVAIRWWQISASNGVTAAVKILDHLANESAKLESY
ncbi:MAG: sel1 repeat family protein [Acidiferrobacterales bacterium]|nr:sel1 repeat family protein [Acidiferrobacterales bacterium]